MRNQDIPFRRRPEEENSKLKKSSGFLPFRPQMAMMALENQPRISKNKANPLPPPSFFDQNQRRIQSRPFPSYGGHIPRLKPRFSEDLKTDAELENVEALDMFLDKYFHLRKPLSLQNLTSEGPMIAEGRKPSSERKIRGYSGGTRKRVAGLVDPLGDLADISMNTMQVRM